jgi:hypothetical protein
MGIVVVGPKDRRKTQPGEHLVNTTSQAANDWQRGLSPFFLGPCALYDGRTARRMENAWQFSKVYPDHADATGMPLETYWKWAESGWRSDLAHRYPMGKGRKPLYLLWEGERFGYVEGRLRVYWRLYRDSVRVSPAFERLRTLHASGAQIVLFDFDGYNHEAMGLRLRDALLNDQRPMGHAFVLKSMLLFGEKVEADEVLRSGY